MDERRVQGKHAGLTREQVVRAAVLLADRDGAAALTMRGLARELGVEAMTLYHHVPSKEALQDAVVEHVMVEYVVAAADGGARAGVGEDGAGGTARPERWADVVASYARGLHRGLAAHPGAVRFFATRPALTTRNMTEIERLLEALRDAGFDAHTALLVVHAVAGSVIGQHLVGAPDDSDRIADVIATSNGGGELPVLAEAVASGPVTMEARLDLTVRSLIAGFESLLTGV